MAGSLIFGPRLICSNCTVTVQSNIVEIDKGTTRESWSDIASGIEVLFTFSNSYRDGSYGGDNERYTGTISGVSAYLDRPDVRLRIDNFPLMPEFVGSFWRVNSSTHHPAGLGGLQCSRYQLKVSRLLMPAVSVGPVNPPSVSGFAIHNIHWLKESGLITADIGDDVTSIPSWGSGTSWVSVGPNYAKLQQDDIGRYYLDFSTNALYTLTPPSNATKWSCCVAYKTTDDGSYTVNRRLIGSYNTSLYQVTIGPYRDSGGHYKGRFQFDGDISTGSSDTDFSYNFDSIIQNGSTDYMSAYNSGSIVSDTNTNSFTLRYNSMLWSLGGGYSPAQYYRGRYYGSFFANTNWDVYQREAVENYMNSPNPGV
jgi:hypothetical protein